jgi:hypothetical protein
VEREPRSALEDSVGSEEGCPDVDRRGGDPEVVGVGSVAERMPRLSARESKIGGGREQPIAHRDNGGRLDRLFKALAPRPIQLPGLRSGVRSR